MVEDASKTLWAVCRACGHTWAAGYYPLELGKLAEIVGQHANCPKCGEPGCVAKQDGGELLEGVDD